MSRHNALLFAGWIVLRLVCRADSGINGMHLTLTGLLLSWCQVSRLQVAELVAAAVANPELAENKVTAKPYACFTGSQDFVDSSEY